jgi:hypothetical protein
VKLSIFDFADIRNANAHRFGEDRLLDVTVGPSLPHSIAESHELVP